MGVNKYYNKLWKNPRKNNPAYAKRLVKWRGQKAVTRVKNPTRLDRAHRIGYKAKQGVNVYRVRIKKGARKRERPRSGRKPKKYGQSRYSPKISFKTVAEQRAQRKNPGLRVLNSYEVGDDGKHKWFEVIMINPELPQINKDKDYKRLCTNKHRKRVFRGLTSSGRKGRGLHKKGKGTEKNRPSIKAHNTRGK